MTPMEKEFYSFQYAFILPIVFEGLAALAFMWTIKYVVKDKEKADEYIHIAQSNEKGTFFYKIF